MDLAEWTAQVEADAKGLIFLDNLAFDFEQSFIDAATFSEFVETIRAAPPPTPSPGKLSCAVVTEDAINSKRLFLRGPKIAPATPGALPLFSSRVVTVFRVDEFSVHYLFRSLRRRRFSSPHLPPSAIVRQHISTGTPPRRLNAVLRGSREMLWITTAESISYDTSAGKLLATIDGVKERLGLLHFQSDETLCICELPNPGTLRRPTALDAGISFIYRSNRSREPFGRAVNLTTYAQEAIEVVAAPIPFGLAGDLQVMDQLSKSHSVVWRKLTDSVDLAAVKALAAILK